MVKKTANHPLTPREFVIAGLLNEGPSHGYEIEQKIKNRGLRNWTRIGFSSIYHVLGKLKKAGYVTQRNKVVNGKLQRVYNLTVEGREALNRQIRSSITMVGKGAGDFDVAISNTVEMPPVRVRGLLQKRIGNLEKQIQTLKQLREEKLKEGAPDIPAVMILFDRPVALMQAEKEFLQSYIEKF